MLPTAFGAKIYPPCHWLWNIPIHFLLLLSSSVTKKAEVARFARGMEELCRPSPATRGPSLPPTGVDAAPSPDLAMSPIPCPLRPASPLPCPQWPHGGSFPGSGSGGARAPLLPPARIGAALDPAVSLPLLSLPARVSSFYASGIYGRRAPSPPLRVRVQHPPPLRDGARRVLSPVWCLPMNLLPSEAAPSELHPPPQHALEEEEKRGQRTETTCQ